MKRSRVLLIDGDLNRLANLERALFRREVIVRTAPTGIYALTLIERDCPDLVAVRAPLPDMSVEEFAEILRSDPALSQVKLAVLVYNGYRPKSPVAAVLQDDGSPDRVAGELGALAARFAGASEAARDRRRDGALPPSHTLFGSLGVLNLVELTQAFCQARRTGKLVLTILGESAEIIFDGGRVVHATFCDLDGRAAFARVLAMTEKAPQTMFYFEALDRAEMGPVPRTIEMTVEHFLLSIAIDQDERIARS